MLCQRVTVAIHQVAEQEYRILLLRAASLEDRAKAADRELRSLGKRVKVRRTRKQVQMQTILEDVERAKERARTVERYFKNEVGGFALEVERAAATRLESIEEFAKALEKLRMLRFGSLDAIIEVRSSTPAPHSPSAFLTLCHFSLFLSLVRIGYA